jgi:hypothetical protein
MEISYRVVVFFFLTPPFVFCDREQAEYATLRADLHAIMLRLQPAGAAAAAAAQPAAAQHAEPPLARQVVFKPKPAAAAHVQF